MNAKSRQSASSNQVGLAPKVLVTEPLFADEALLGTIVRIESRPDLWKDRASLVLEVKDASALVVRNQTQVDAELLASANQLLVVGRLGSGLDNLDLVALNTRGIEVVHGGGLNSRAVAEFTFGAALAVARGIAKSDRAVRSGVWKREPGVELRGRTLGVVGLGRVGSETAHLGRVFGMRVLGFDPYAVRVPTGVHRVQLQKLLASSYLVAVHVPYTNETRAIISSRELAIMQSGAILVNASRGGVIDEDALYEAIISGHLGGAALDVRNIEPSSSVDRFYALDNVVLTPHIAGLTRESQSSIARSVLSAVRTIVEGRVLAAREARQSNEPHE